MLTQLKISVRKKKCCVNIFFLDCSTVSNNSENDDIFIEGTTRPRSISQPLATKKTSTSLRTQLTNTRNKLSEGKIYFDRNFNYTELAKLIRDSSSLAAPGNKVRCDTVTRRSIAINQALKYRKESKLPYWVRIKQIRSDVLSVNRLCVPLKGKILQRRNHSSTILHLDALAATINFGISCNFEDDSSRNNLIRRAFAPSLWLTDRY